METEERYISLLYLHRLCKNPNKEFRYKTEQSELYSESSWGEGISFISLFFHLSLSVHFDVSLLKILFIFNWRILALQCCVGFCQQHESATGIHVSPPFWTLLSLPAPGCHRALVCTLSCSRFPLAVPRVVMCAFPCSCLSVPPSPSLNVSTSLLCVCISIAALHIGSSVPSF